MIVRLLGDTQIATSWPLAEEHSMRHYFFFRSVYAFLSAKVSTVLPLCLSARLAAIAIAMTKKTLVKIMPPNKNNYVLTKLVHPNRDLGQKHEALR